MGTWFSASAVVPELILAWSLNNAGRAYPAYVEGVASIYDSTGGYNTLDITGSFHNGQYLLVYEEETYASGEYNIYGMLIGSLEYVYVPLVVR